MNGYTKIFGRILDSTIWQEDLATKVLWITMLVMVNRNGYVLASIPGLAKRAGISLEDCEASLAKLEAPDAYSQSKIAEGRRIKAINGGWLIINYENYRHQLDADEQREKDRIRKAQYRLSHNLSRVVPDCPTLSQTVPLSPVESDIATATATATAKEKSNPFASQVNEIYELYPRKTGRRQALKAIEAAIKRVVEGEYLNEKQSEAEAIEGIKNRTAQFAASAAGQRGQYTPHPATWFNRSSYLDDPASWSCEGPGDTERWRDHAKPTRTQERVSNNRESILLGLGISREARPSKSSVQDGDDARRSPRLETDI